MSPRAWGQSLMRADRSRASIATGLRFEAFVSQFPTEHTVAATWDRRMIEARGRAIGREFRSRGVHTHLGPVTGGPLGRSPLGGRNWEGFSPDPYLSSVASYLTVRAIQSQGVITSLKHYIGYEQETFRTARWRINGTVQTFRQISSDIDGEPPSSLRTIGMALSDLARLWCATSRQDAPRDLFAELCGSCPSRFRVGDGVVQQPERNPRVRERARTERDPQAGAQLPGLCHVRVRIPVTRHLPVTCCR